ncbi:hypothetical protein EDB81DRAFT_897304 [Dactylonectria macrodidyma]|uniref:Uncharacterized protein n=1 Tax=Dactylonectria macrodidyma TaxID=307937 RepID=A0A9P9FU11_9HYPO|nr:hypothetical protein EDB81DRAFT_897304 [Dactylonectria macrodidyma]
MSSQSFIISGLLIFSSFSPIWGAAINTTVILPPDTSNHGNPDLLCRPPKWVDITIFFLGNYVAHVGTIVTNPGESTTSVIFASIFALLFPVTGVVRGVNAIKSMAIFGKNDLERAARSGALYMVTYGAGRHPILERRVHGKYELREGDTFEIVGRQAVFQGEEGEQVSWTDRLKILLTGAKPEQNFTSISCSYDLAKILVALGQTIFAAATLYQTRGDQISIYGYAAFGLTVTPYAMMSVVNLLGNLVRPTYPAMYIVRPPDPIKPNPDQPNYTELMSDYERGVELVTRLTSEFDGVVGKLQEQANPYTSVSGCFEDCTIATFAAIQIAIVGGLSFFHGGSSTTFQRVCTMTWLAVGCFLAKFVHNASERLYSWHQYNGAKKRLIDTRREYLRAEPGILRMGVRLRAIQVELNDLPNEEAIPDIIQLDPNEVQLEEIHAFLKSSEEHTPAQAQLEEIVTFLISLGRHVGTIIDLKQKEGLEQTIGPLNEMNSELNQIGPFVRRLGQSPGLMEIFLPKLAAVDFQGTMSRETPLPEEERVLKRRHQDMENLRNRLKQREDIWNDIRRPGCTTYWILGIYALCGVPAILGFIVVGQMLHEYGVCVRIAR